MLTVDCKSPLTYFPPLEQQSWEAALTELILQILQAAVAQGGANFLPGRLFLLSHKNFQLGKM